MIINHEKISKSLNNFFTVHDILKYYNTKTIHYFLISNHYRNQLNYNEKNLKQTHTTLKHLYTTLHNTNKTVTPTDNETFKTHFIETINDDFNTPKTYSILFNITHKINHLKTKNITTTNTITSHLHKLSTVLNLLKQKPKTFLQNDAQTNDNEITKIKTLIQQHLNTHKTKN